MGAFCLENQGIHKLFTKYNEIEIDICPEIIYIDYSNCY